MFDFDLRKYLQVEQLRLELTAMRCFSCIESTHINTNAHYVRLFLYYMLPLLFHVRLFCRQKQKLSYSTFSKTALRLLWIGDHFLFFFLLMNLTHNCLLHCHRIQKKNACLYCVYSIWWTWKLGQAVPITILMLNEHHHNIEYVLHKHMRIWD